MSRLILDASFILILNTPHTPKIQYSPEVTLYAIHTCVFWRGTLNIGWLGVCEY